MVPESPKTPRSPDNPASAGIAESAANPASAGIPASASSAGSAGSPDRAGSADSAESAIGAERGDRPAGAASPASVENAAEHRQLRRVVFLMNDMHRPNGIVSATDLLAAEMRARGLAVDIWCFGACDPELRERHHVIDVVPGRRLTTKMPGFASPG